ncbi:MAG TPA: HEAT repeat domain-containing protein [Vicinamibacterales bacterium]|nr:HEAT repeat domain-containing protein [Vicinamibacterales bacterium]
MPTLFQRLLAQVVSFRPGEAITAWLMFGYAFLVMTAYNVIKPATRSKAIAALGADNLPYLLILSAVAVGALMFGYSRAMARVPRARVAPVTHLALAVLLVLFWALFVAGAPWAAVAFYVFGLLFGLLVISQFWTLANELYDARQARRLFGFIGGGASLGGLAGASITAWLVGWTGTNGLLLIGAGTLLVSAVVVSRITVPPGASTSPVDEADTPQPGGWGLLRDSRHLRLIAIVIAVGAIAAVFVEQQLNMAAEEVAASEDGITRLLGQVTMVLSLAGFVVQIGLTSRLQQSFGLAGALLLLPGVLGLSSIAMLATGALWAPALARVLDTTLRYTVDRTTREVLFLPLAADLRHRAKPFLDVTIDRAARGLAGALLLVLVQPWGLGLHWRQIAWANLVIVIGWVCIARIAHREYLDTFRRSLRARVMEPAALRHEAVDDRSVALLTIELHSGDDAAVLYAIDMLASLSRGHLVPVALLAHRDPRVRARAALALGGAGVVSPASATAVRGLLGDRDTEVRAAAIRAIAHRAADEDIGTLRHYVDDPAARVAAAAAVGLAQSRDAADASAAEAALAGLIARADDPAARREAAAALAQIANPAFRPLLVPLIHDHDDTVAREAIAAAGAIVDPDPLLVPALVSRLGHRTLKKAARDALSGYGGEVVGILAHVMADSSEHPWVRRHVPATLAAIPSQRSVDALVRALGDPDGFLRFKSLVALETLSRAPHALRAPAGVLAARLTSETSRYCELLTLHQNLLDHDPAAPATLLARALVDKRDRTLDRMFRLISVLHPNEDVAAVRYALDHGDGPARAGALEYLDHTLPPDLRRRVLPLLEDTSPADRVRHANRLLRSRPRDLADTLAQLVHDDDPVVAASAVQYCAERGCAAALADDLAYLLSRPATHALVREAVRGARGDAADDAQTPGLPVVELANRLRAIDVFAIVTVDELFRIAQGARLVRYPSGVTIAVRETMPTNVLFLLEGSVHRAGDAAERMAAPAAVHLTSVLAGQPHPHTLMAATNLMGLSLASSVWLAMLGDNVATAQGVCQLLGASIATDEPIGPTAPVAGDGALPDAVTLVTRLRLEPVFADATVEHLTSLARVMRVVSLRKGQVVWDRSHAPALLYLLSGRVQSDEPDAGLVAEAGWMVGALDTLTGRDPAQRVVVTREGRALRLDRQDLFAVLADHTQLLQRVCGNLVRMGGSQGRNR